MEIKIDPALTKSELIAKSYHWLDKAVDMEAEGKTGKMVGMAFDRALAFENKAFD